MLPAEFAGYLHVLFSADALSAGGLIEGILERSADFAADLAVRLRERVYFKTVPALASALARRLGHEATPSHLDDAYEQVMVILFRLLFVAYAEDKDLLPYRTNSHYADHSLKLRARRLTEDPPRRPGGLRRVGHRPVGRRETTVARGGHRQLGVGVYPRTTAGSSPMNPT